MGDIKINKRKNGQEEKRRLRVAKTENKMEKIMKEKIRNNLVISGIDMDTKDEETLLEAMGSMLEKTLDIKANVAKAYKVGPQKYIIEIQNFNEKITILKESID